MGMEAIVYTSNTGHTAAYARLLGEKTGLAVLTLDEAIRTLEKGKTVIYMGWLWASHVKGLPKAQKNFDIAAVCAVGLCDTGTLLDQVRSASVIAEHTPLFTLQGGMNRGRLKGVNKFVISMLYKGLSDKKDRTEQDERMLELLSHDASYVSEENLKEVLKWYDEAQIGGTCEKI